VDSTPNLGLPYIMAAQSQKHVTHNEAIRALDAVVQLSVLDRNLGVPPSSPAEGARYIVAASPSGAWSGHAGKVAAYQDGAWMFYVPSEGWIAWVADEDIAVVWTGSAWGSLATGEGGGGDGDFETLGINASADSTNRLTVAADATLLNHDGDGHQLKINKAEAGDTASLLYQTGFSGRAELGLAGDDDFHFKVSPDGATWKEAIVIDRASGEVSFPFTSLGEGGSGAPTDGEYIVKAASGGLSAERVLTDTATVNWDYATGGQAKASVPNAAITYAKIQDVSATDKLLGRASSGAGDVEEIACTAFARSLLDGADHARARHRQQRAGPPCSPSRHCRSRSGGWRGDRVGRRLGPLHDRNRRRWRGWRRPDRRRVHRQGGARQPFGRACVDRYGQRGLGLRYRRPG
jgi:hypothetical protein